MKPADLLAIAAPAARSPATEARPQPSPGDEAAAFARALGEAADRARPGRLSEAARLVEAEPSLPRPAPSEAGGRGGVVGERPGHPAGPGRFAWLEALGGAEGGDMRQWLQALRSAAGGAPAGEGAESAAAASETNPFFQALDALRDAVKAALADPAAAAAPAGQLPPAVQTALDAAVAAAPPAIAGRVQGFAARFTERLLARLSGEAAAPAAEPAAPPVAAESRSPVAAAVLAAVDRAGAEPALAAPLLPDGQPRDKPADARPAPAAAGPAAEPATASAAAAAPAARPQPEAGTEPAALAGETALAAAPVEVDPLSGEPAPAALPPSAQAAAETRAAALTAVRGSPEIAAQLAAVITRRLEARTTRFDMELNPAELGRVDVRLRIDADGRVAAQLAFDNPVAAAEMRGRADELRRHLADAGFQVASEDLSFSDRQRGSFDGRRGSPDPEALQSARENAFSDADRTLRLADDAARLKARTVLGLDLRV